MKAWTTLAFLPDVRQLPFEPWRASGVGRAWQHWGAMIVALLIATLVTTLSTTLSAVGVMAQSSAEVAVAVRPSVDGVLHASIVGASFSAVDYTPDGGDNQVATGMIQLRVVDSTGLGSAWSVRVRADSDFWNANDDRKIAASNLQLAQPTLRQQKNPAGCGSGGKSWDGSEHAFGPLSDGQLSGRVRF